MPAFTATAPGKIILFGEHAVVYGEPAIAVPVLAIQARAVVSPVISGRSGEIRIEAPDISLSADLNELEIDHPLRVAVSEVIQDKNLERIPACLVQITSTIPLASGLGSSAAISTALINAMAAFLGKRMTNEEISKAAFEVEKIHHSTPSGIDNSVVVYQQPVYYQKGNPLEFLPIKNSFTILIAGSGTPGDTRKAVTAVRESWLAEPDKFNLIFSKIGTISRNAREIIIRGDPRELGPLMDQNFKLLQELGVTTPRLDHLVQTALAGGALGAKLSGGGLGGHIIALVADDPDPVQEMLLGEGYDDVLVTTVGHPLSPAQID